MRIVAMISGTSHDAIDVAVADLHADGDRLALTCVGERSLPYPPALRAQVTDVLPPATTDLAAVCRLDTELGHAFAEAAAQAIAAHGGHADLVVSHGQTVFHWVDERAALGTLQLGQPAWIAERTGVPVLADVRGRDIAAGGQGAPLVSVLDRLLLGEDHPAAALNLGGIANITVLGTGPAIAYDVGPANALLDLAVTRITGGDQTFDADGRIAARGQVDADLLTLLRREPYYTLRPPKSTGKERFHAGYLDAAMARHGREVPGEDLLATLAELTAVTVAEACRGHGVEQVIASGGGVRNTEVMRRLAARLPGVEVTTIDRLGITSDAKEAYAFAVIGFLSANGLPGVVASCTGARKARVLGALLPGGDGGLPPRTVPDGWSPTGLDVRAPT